MRIYEIMNEIQLPTATNEGVNRKGDFVFHLFERVNVTFATISSIIVDIEHIIEILLENSMNGINEHNSNKTNLKLQHFEKCLKLLFREQNSSVFAQCYRIHINWCNENNNNNKNDNENSNRNSNNSYYMKRREKSGRIINCWCFCAGIALENLKKLGLFYYYFIIILLFYYLIILL